MQWDVLVMGVVGAPVLYFGVVAVFVLASAVLSQTLKIGQGKDAVQTEVFAGVGVSPLERVRGFVEEAWWQSLAWSTQVLYTLRLLRMPRGAPGSTPVVIVPGWTENAGTLWWLARALVTAGYDPIAVDFPSTHAPIERNVAFLRDRIREARAEHGVDDVAVVAHSMGGIVTRALMLSDVGHGVRTLVAVASPFRGTWTAPIGGMVLRAASCRDMTPGSDFMMAHGPERVTGVPILSLVGFQENIVSPEWSTVLPEATNVVLDRAWGHEAPLFGGKSFRIIERWLARPGSL